jgi:hypothetical protein
VTDQCYLSWIVAQHKEGPIGARIKKGEGYGLRHRLAIAELDVQDVRCLLSKTPARVFLNKEIR